jgi:hypothetical protein
MADDGPGWRILPDDPNFDYASLPPTPQDAVPPERRWLYDWPRSRGGSLVLRENTGLWLAVMLGPDGCPTLYVIDSITREIIAPYWAN